MFPSLGKPTRSPCHTRARPLLGTSDACIPVGQVPAPVQTGDAPQEGHSQPLPALIPVFSDSSSRPQGGRRGLSSLSGPPSFPQVPPTAHSHCSPHKSSALLHQSLNLFLITSLRKYSWDYFSVFISLLFPFLSFLTLSLSCSCC